MVAPKRKIPLEYFSRKREHWQSPCLEVVDTSAQRRIAVMNPHNPAIPRFDPNWCGGLFRERRLRSGSQLLRAPVIEKFAELHTFSRFSKLCKIENRNHSILVWRKRL